MNVDIFDLKPCAMRSTFICDGPPSLMGAELECISRRDAARLGLVHYATGRPCKHGHLSFRYVRNAACGTCQYQFSAASRAAVAAILRVANS